MSSVTSDVLRAPMRIGGRDVVREEWIDVRNPCDTREVVGRVPQATLADVAAATRAAADAFGVWSAVPPSDRAATLREAGAILAADVDGRGRLLARECGALLSEGRGGVAASSRTLDYYATVGENFEFEEEIASPNGRVVLYRQPMGVAAVIVPWNSPTKLGFLAIAPALMAGNTVVVKPPSDAPLALMDSLRAIEALFPPGTINVVTGAGGTIGEALVTDPIVRKVNFTGSTAVGKAVLAGAASTVKRVSLELGGNDPAVLMADADLDRAIPDLIQGVFDLSGQICYGVKRIYVHSSLFGLFHDQFAAAVDQLVVGNGLDERATMGSLINERQQEWVRGLIAEARAAGARVETLGKKLDPETWDYGYFQLPTVVTGVEQTSTIVQCEQFGPVIPIIPFDSEDEAVRLANDSSFGLGGSVWTEDEERGFSLAQRFEAGTTFVNVHRRGASGVDMPFGGFKESGLGRGHGVVALEEQLELHTVSSRIPA